MVRLREIVVSYVIIYKGPEMVPVREIVESYAIIDKGSEIVPVPGDCMLFQRAL